MKINIKGVIILSIIFCIFISCSSPSSSKTEQVAKKQAIIRITVDRTPILVEWDWWAELWCLRPEVTVSETNGVGVNVTQAKLEFVFNNVGGQLHPKI